MRIKELIKKNKIINEAYTKYKWRERNVSFGRNAIDKRFYVIRRAKSSVGLFSYVADVLGQVRYAVETGYIPIVDMQNSSNTYLEENLVGKKNSWEYYFNQPCEYNLDDIRKAQNVTLGNGLHSGKIDYPTYNIAFDKDKYREWKAIANKYLKVNTEIEQYSEMLFQHLTEGKKTVGVLCRGTDYTSLKPSNHPKQPEIEDLISKVNEYKAKYECTYVYLATEDENCFQIFKKYYHEDLIVTDAKRFCYDGNTYINDISFNRENDAYLRGREYLINILLLAKCQYMVAGASGGTYGALLLTEGYDDYYIFNCGLYK